MLTQHLRSFQALADSGSFAGASARTGLSQSVLSQQLKALEEALGASLLTREGRALSLTPAGKLFYERSKGLLTQMEDIVREVKQFSLSRSETLRIGFLSCYGAREFQNAVSSFARQHPEVGLEILNGSREELYGAILAGEVNLVLNNHRLLRSEDVVGCELVQSRCYVELPPEHPLSGLDRLETEHLKDGRCILVADAAHRQAEQAYYREAIGFQGEFLFARSLEQARSMVASGQGFLPVEGVGEPPEEGPSVARLPLYQQERPVLRRYCAFWRADRNTQLVEEFASLLREQYAPGADESGPVDRVSDKAP